MNFTPTLSGYSATVALLVSVTPAAAQGIYTPNAPAQLPPMRVEVLDATAFRDIETGAVYRLYGIDSCDLQQLAYLGRQPWRCGAVSVAWLTNATLGKWVSCYVVREKNGERLGRCSSSEHGDLAADMLKEGVAVTLPAAEDQNIRAYAAAQEGAKKSYKGLWSSQFQMPWEYRSKSKEPLARP